MVRRGSGLGEPGQSFGMRYNEGVVAYLVWLGGWSGEHDSTYSMVGVDRVRGDLIGQDLL